VAKRKRRKKSRIRTVLLFLLTPLVVWAVAFVIWLYWDDIVRNLTPGKDTSKPVAKRARKSETNQSPDRNDDKRPKEKILDEDRKTLDEIIRRENR
jgi:hypothetical protein